MLKFTKAGGYQCFTGTWYFHLPLSLEDGGNMYLPDIGTHLADSMMLYPRKPKLESLLP